MTQPPDDERVLPDQTTDDTDAGWGEADPDDDTRRLLDDVPPHHVERD